MKVGARMIQTGKGETNGNVYFLASNGFTVDDSTVSNFAEGDDGKCKRTYVNAKQRLQKIVHSIDAKLIEHQNAFLAKDDCFAFKDQTKEITTKLKSKRLNIKIEKEKSKLTIMLSRSNELSENSRTHFRGELIPPLFNGYIDINRFCSKKIVTLGYVRLEFDKRNLSTEYNENFRKVNTLKEFLRANEVVRFENEVNQELANQGVNVTELHLKLNSKLSILKEKLENNNNCVGAWNKFSVDITKYFKIQSPDFTFNDMNNDW